MEHHQSDPRTLWLTDSIVTQILSYLGPESLARTDTVNHLLRRLTHSEELWKPLVNSYLPSPIECCKPAPSFRQLYITFHPYWFILKSRFWLSDEQPSGQLVIAQFDPVHLCIEAWVIGAHCQDLENRPWTLDPEVLIREVNTSVYIDRRQLVFRLGVKHEHWSRDEEHHGLPRKHVLSLGNSWTGLPVVEDFATWPTPHMTSPARTPSISTSEGRLAADQSVTVPTACHPTFQLRIRVEHHQDDGTTGTDRSDTTHESGMVEEIITYGTISPTSYTPTIEKPWQGIWCGDYFDHGVEFLLMLQPEPSNEATKPKTVYGVQEQCLEQLGSRLDENPLLSHHPCRSLLAVKLTGDSNVPRWKYSFMVPDLFDTGLLRVAGEEEFRGAPVIRSWLHVAAQNFEYDTYVPSQLILISHDRLAQYWEGGGCIKYYRRVDIESLTFA